MSQNAMAPEPWVVPMLRVASLLALVRGLILFFTSQRASDRRPELSRTPPYRRGCKNMIGSVGQPISLRSACWRVYRSGLQN